MISQLGLTYSESALAGNVSVSAITDTDIIKISVSDVNNQLAADIANEIARVFMEDIKTRYNLQNVSVLDEAVAESSPYNVNIAKEIVLYILIGVVLGCAIVFVMFYFDTSIKSSTEIEEKFRLAVLGNVPYVEKRGS